MEGDQGAEISSDEEDARAEIREYFKPTKHAVKHQVSLVSPFGRGNTVTQIHSTLDEEEDPFRLSSAQIINCVSSKFRIDLTIVCALFVLSLFTGKLNSARVLIDELKLIFAIKEKAPLVIHKTLVEEQAFSLMTALRLQSVKERVHKLKQTAKRNIEHINKKQASFKKDYDATPAPRRKKARNIAPQMQPLHDCLDLWLRHALIDRTLKMVTNQQV